jgi:hypothetical protein
MGAEVDILKIATDSGMQVMLDGSIGREEFRSVVGSVQALQRFADALCMLDARETHDVHARVDTSDHLIDRRAIARLIEADPLLFI